MPLYPSQDLKIVTPPMDSVGYALCGLAGGWYARSWQPVEVPTPTCVCQCSVGICEGWNGWTVLAALFFNSIFWLCVGVALAGYYRLGWDTPHYPAISPGKGIKGGQGVLGKTIKITS